MALILSSTYAVLVAPKIAVDTFLLASVHPNAN